MEATSFLGTKQLIRDFLYQSDTIKCLIMLLFCRGGKWWDEIFVSLDMSYNWNNRKELKATEKEIN